MEREPSREASFAAAWGEAVDLGGTWHAVAADEDRRRTFFDPGHDTAGWVGVAVPGSWTPASAPGGAAGPVLLRRLVDRPTGPPAGAPAPVEPRWWLTFDGIGPDAVVWFDGHLLGDTDDADAPHTFEVTDPLGRAGTEPLVLALDVGAAPTPARRRRRDLAGARPERSAGPWGDVRLHATGPVRLAGLRLRCTRADEAVGVLAWRATLDTLVARSVDLRVRVHTDDGRPAVTATSVVPLAAGDNVVDGEVRIEDPPRWWPRALGAPSLVRVEVEVVLRGDDPELAAVTGNDGGGVAAVVSDRWSGRSAFRSVAWRRGVLEVNGRRCFVRGLVLEPPPGPRRAVTARDAAALLDSPVGAAVDLLRCRGHLPAPALLDAADAAGVLVWADLPLVGGMHPSVRRRAGTLARDAVDRLAHHPSLALWCCHDAPPPGRNRWVLDRSLRRSLQVADGTRPVLERAPAALPPGSAVDVARALLVWPAAGRFAAAPRRPSPPPATETARTVGVLRRLRFRPVGGFALRVDPADGAVAAALAPVVAVVDPLPAEVRVGQRLRLRVHVVNDGPRPVLDAVVLVRVRWPGGELRRAWTGGAGPDAAVPVGVVDLRVPQVHGELDVDVTWWGPGLERRSSRDRTTVTHD